MNVNNYFSFYVFLQDDAEREENFWNWGAEKKWRKWYTQCWSRIVTSNGNERKKLPSYGKGNR